MYVESYRCGCSIELVSKSLLPGYCSKHGENRNQLICLNRCALCGRDTPKQNLEKHHLVPRAKKGKEYIQVCCDCGNQIHKLFTIKELETTYNSFESLIENQEVQKWIKWIRTKKEFGFCMKSKKKK